MSYIKEQQLTLDDVSGMKKLVQFTDIEPTPCDDDWFTPQSIVQELDGIIGQDEAKQAAAMIVYELLEFQLPTTSLFCGKTGCGKTEIFRQLSRAYPGLIQIADASNLSASGWSGDLHLADLLSTKNFDPSPQKWQGFRILVLDEFDKIWMHRGGTGGKDGKYFNILQSQLLKLFEHDSSAFPGAYPAENIAIVCCGAFSSIYEARDSKKGSIGFSCATKDEKSKKSLRDELVTVGELLPELVGRFDRCIEMQEPSLAVYEEIARRELRKLEADIHKSIRIEWSLVSTIASEALTAGLGARYIRNQLFMKAENALYDDLFCSEIRIGNSPIMPEFMA